MNLALFNPATASPDECKKAQSELALHGYYFAPIDGKFGPLSRAALDRWRMEQTVADTTRLATVGGLPVYRTAAGAIVFSAGMQIDADGAARAYGPGNLGLDYTANAGRPGNFWGIVTGSNGVPIVQGATDPAPGYYISTTSLQDPAFSKRDPRRYVDSDSIPFIVLPGRHCERWGCKLGDLAKVERIGTGQASYAVFADVGPRDHLGEGSIALARQLGLDPNPKRGGAERGILYTVWPGSAVGWPLSARDIAAAAGKLDKPGA